MSKIEKINKSENLLPSDKLRELETILWEHFCSEIRNLDDVVKVKEFVQNMEEIYKKYLDNYDFSESQKRKILNYCLEE